MDKRNNDERKHIPFIRIESPRHRRQSNISISSDSSEESLPNDAPLARQQRCSVDIDTMTPKFEEKFQINGTHRKSNSYLDDSELNDSIHDVM